MNKSLYIPFEVENLIIAEHNGQPYVAMRPIVETLGLNWACQAKKIQKNFRKYGCRRIATHTNSGIQEMLYIPLDKFHGWLFGVNSAKVRPDLREIIDRYQEEGFEVLNDYWSRVELIQIKVRAELGLLRSQ